MLNVLNYYYEPIGSMTLGVLRIGLFITLLIYQEQLHVVIATSYTALQKKPNTWSRGLYQSYIALAFYHLTFRMIFILTTRGL